MPSLVDAQRHRVDATGGQFGSMKVVGIECS